MDLTGRFGPNAGSGIHALATGISLHLVVYCGVNCSCFIDQSRRAPSRSV